LITLTAAEPTAAQERQWVAEAGAGYAGLIDDATIDYLALHGSVRRRLTPRITLGPEITMMTGGIETRDLNLLLTATVTCDLTRERTVTPFLAAGGGLFWGREQLVGGPYWSSDPAFTAGGGLRVRATEALSWTAEYRFGWELHHRVSAGLSARW
jgi:hypothetical protein